MKGELIVREIKERTQHPDNRLNDKNIIEKCHSGDIFLLNIINPYPTTSSKAVSLKRTVCVSKRRSVQPCEINLHPGDPIGEDDIHEYLLLDGGANANIASSIKVNLHDIRPQSNMITGINSNDAEYNLIGFDAEYGDWFITNINPFNQLPYAILGRESLRKSFSKIEDIVEKVNLIDGSVQNIVVGERYQNIKNKLNYEFLEYPSLGESYRGMLFYRSIKAKNSIVNSGKNKRVRINEPDRDLVKSINLETPNINMDNNYTNASSWTLINGANSTINNNTISTTGHVRTKRAKIAYTFWKNSGFQNPRTFIKTINHHSKDRGFNSADFKLAMEMYGTEAYDAGRSVRTSSQIPIQDDEQYAPHYSNQQSLHSDLFFVFGHTFLISYMYPLANVEMDVIANKEYESIATGLSLHISRMKSLGFKIKTLEFDSEGSIVNKEMLFKDIGVKSYNLPSGSHSGRAEKSVRHVKDICRSLEKQFEIDGKTVPKSLTPALIKMVQNLINWETKQGVRSEDTPPNEIKWKRKMNADDQKHSFLDLVHSHAPTSTKYSLVDQSRIDSCLALYPDNNSNWYYLKLSTYKVVKRNNGKSIDKWDDLTSRIMKTKKKEEDDERAALILRKLIKKNNNRKLTPAQERLLMDTRFLFHEEIYDISKLSEGEVAAPNIEISRNIADDETLKNLDEEKTIIEVKGEDVNTITGNSLEMCRLDTEKGKEISINELNSISNLQQSKHSSSWTLINGTNSTGESVESHNNIINPAINDVSTIASPGIIKAGTRRPPNPRKVKIMKINDGDYQDSESDDIPGDTLIWNTPTEDDGSRTGIEDYGFQRYANDMPVKGNLSKEEATAKMVKEVETLKDKLIRDEEIEINLEDNRRRSTRTTPSRYRRASHAKSSSAIKDNIKLLASKLPGYNGKELPHGTITYAQAKEYFNELADKSVMEELVALVELQVFEGRYQNFLTLEERKRILRTHLIMKVKTDSQGVFQRLKSRLVCNGSIEIKESFDKFGLYSPPDF